jgi:EAL domain-containing protein (putative c-di-GMP-specific phosphodiesterase class I)/GGDEF domain-containing protein
MSIDVQRFMTFAFASADLLVEIGDGQKVTYAIGATTGLTDRGERELLGQDWRVLIAPDDHSLVESMLARLKLGSRVGPVVVRLAYRDKAGTTRDALFAACRLPMRPQATAFALGRISLATAAIAKAGRRDPSTQLLDSASFAEMAGQLGEAARGQGQDVEMTLLDLAGLKNLKTKNPGGGEALVAKIAGLLRAASVDGNAAGRVGDERFGVVHDASLDKSDLERQLKAMTADADQSGIGVAVANRSVDLANNDLPTDAALRAIRYSVDRFANDGAGAVASSLTETFETMVSTTLKRVREFNRAVRESAFTLAYQPIVTLHDGRMHHFEVLSRFKTDESPMETIQFAEDIGIIERFDLAVAERTFEFLRIPRLDKRIKLAINVSGRSMENSIFMKCLIDLLEANRSLGDRLALEITESARLKDLDATNRMIQEMRKRGFKVCLDDFGAGAASFQYLQALNIDFVKIDGAYIKRIVESPRDEAMIKGIVRLCEDLGVGTIAEMVETKTQVDKLRAIGVRYGQGWYFGKPTVEPLIPWGYDDPQPGQAAAANSGAAAD